jgi:uncharacterized oligopeptide transporter (OPT) family protein
MLKQLTDEQIRTMTLEEKDRWWLEHVYRGNMPQLTLRAALTGMLLGGMLSLTNLYIGIKTGWTLGVGITSVILSFALFKVISQLGLGAPMTLLENNAMQSIATSAGYMTMPLVSSISAYMMVTKQVVPMWQVIVWMIAVSMLGVLFAFPLKKRFINDEQMPFPEGKACGIVMEGLHNDEGGESLLKIRLLASAAAFSAFWKVFSSKFLLSELGLLFLKIPHYFDESIYKLGYRVTLMGTQLKTMTIRVESDIVLVAAGALMGMRAGASLLLGACVNYFLLVPYLISIQIIRPDARGVLGFKEITMWSLWGGVAMMTTASLFSFFSKPKMLLEAFSRFFDKRESSDVLKDIELPMSVFLIGIPILGIVVVYLTHLFFGVSILMGAIALPLIFVFTVIAVHSTALTGITPTGALGKLTQLTYAILAPNNISTNIMTAGINGEVASNASNLLMDIKPGYMLGAKPRQQAIGHILGIFAGGLVATPVFFYLFQGKVSMLGTEELPMISAKIWVGVAEVLTKGLSFLHPSALWAMLVGACLGVLMEIAKIRTQGRFPLSPVAMGLAFVLPFYTSLSMFLGCFVFWAGGLFWKEGSTIHRMILKNQETLAAGIIAGGALLEIALQLIEISMNN